MIARPDPSQFFLDRRYYLGYTFIRKPEMEGYFMKTAISIPDKLFLAADKYAKNAGISRSHLYAKAVAKFLEQQLTGQITKQLDDIYSNNSAELSKSLSTMQFSSMEKEEW